MDETPFLSHFSPQWTRPEALEQILVQRESLLSDSVEKIRESILTGNKHHLLFIGSRGAGKTHLITLIHHRLQQADLLDRARFAWLNEDEIATSFLKLLVLIYRSLSARYPDEFPASTVRALAGLEALAAEDKLGQSLLRDLGNRTLVVLMENLDSLFRTLPEAELLRWRAFVQNHPVFATIGTAQALFAGVSERTEPFFGFFDTRHLEPLSVEDARLLLKNIARLQRKADLLEFLETPTGKARVAAIHDLAGGNPRLYLIFSEFLTRTALNELVRPFEEMVDRQLTSYYQERLRWLTPLQREIVQLLCHHGRPIPVKQIAEGLFTTQGTISGQLRQLREMHYLRFQSLGREVFYELAEPLMRLALQVKETHNRRPLALIVDFLRVWHDRQDIEQRLAQLGSASPDHRYYAEALAMLDSGAPNLRHEILRDGLDNLSPDQWDDEALNRARCLAEESDLPADWNRLGTILLDRKEWDEAVRAFTRVIESMSASVEEVSVALNMRAFAYVEVGRKEEAIGDWTRIIQSPGTTTELLTWALVQRGTHLVGEEAIANFTRAIEIPGAPAFALEWAMLGRGVQHGRIGRHDEAIADLSRVVALPGVSADGAALALTFRSLQNALQRRVHVAIADLSRAIAIEGVSAERLAMALCYRAELRFLNEERNEAVADLKNAIELPEASVEVIARARGLLAMVQAHSGQTEAALRDFARLLATSNTATTTAVIPRLHLFAPTIVQAILAHTTDPQRWTTRLREFLPLFARHGGLAQLGDALVQHLPKLATSPLNHAAYDAWATAWSDALDVLSSEEKDRLEIPLRLLRAGIDYLKTQNVVSLLVLPAEERRILRQTLGLPAETQE